MTKSPRVGIGIIVVHKGKILVSLRKGKHGKNSWGLPGGHLEYGEKIKDGALRELKEEVGIKVADITFLTFTEDFFYTEGEHYLTIFMKCQYLSGDINVLEPTKMVAWRWCSLSRLPQPLFLPLANLVKKVKRKEITL